jgi:hypothetical protein
MIKALTVRVVRRIRNLTDLRRARFVREVHEGESEFEAADTTRFDDVEHMNAEIERGYLDEHPGNED